MKIFEIDKVYLPKELPLTELPEERKKMVLEMCIRDRANTALNRESGKRKPKRTRRLSR